jgi:hypothetical protein
MVTRLNPDRRARVGKRKLTGAGLAAYRLAADSAAEVTATTDVLALLWPSYRPWTAACRTAYSKVASPELTASTAALTMIFRTGDSGSGNGGDGIWALILATV